MKKPTRKAIASIAILVVFLLSAIFVLCRKQENGRLPANTYYGNIEIGNLPPAEAAARIEQSAHAFEGEGITLAHAGREAELTAVAASFDSGISEKNFQYEIDGLENELKGYSRQSLLSRLFRNWTGRPLAIKPAYSLDIDNIKEFVVDALPETTNAAVDAAFIFDKKKITISPERPGKEVDWEDLFAELDKRLISFDQEKIALKTKTDYPSIYARDLSGLETEADKLTANPLILLFKEKEFPVSRGDIASWLGITKEGSGFKLAFEADRINTYLEEKVAPAVNIEPQTPRFEIKDGKVTSWQLGSEGYALEAATSTAMIMEKYVGANEEKVELSAATTAPDTTASFDIKEIVGTGHSRFSGSPKNRRHNIAVGAAALHGLVIKPEEEFSLIKALGNIDAKGGYLPELVIKNNKTIPEYGGGLCQVGTTMFRAALATGLPITARQNHSYRVSYYEPAGTDATIYDPWPDFRFVNDTGKNILIQSRIEGDDLYFDFWGTEDGRVATTTYPVIYNVVKPAPTKIVETDELAPGEKKCTEKAHNGADAWFDYTVIYPEGSTTTPEVKRRFTSHYVPWQEVCLVGKSASSTPSTATSTPETATTTPETGN